MPRAAHASNTVLFRDSDALPPAEKILRIIENAHDHLHLLEMNGEKCAGRQISKLRWYDRPARQSKEERIS